MKTNILLIAAMGRNRVIGKDGKLPWHMPADMDRFLKLTRGKPVIMGRKTHESIGKLLPDRVNVVISRTRGAFAGGDLRVVSSIEEALQAVRGREEAWVVGGGNVFEQFLPLADGIYLTLIDHDFEGDAFFPELKEDEWRKVQNICHEPDEKDPHPYAFQLFVPAKTREEVGVA